MKTSNYHYDGDKNFNIKEFDTNDTADFKDREEAVDDFVENLLAINRIQQRLYAERKEGVIFIFQAMDAAGKDGVVRTVFSTLSPHGVKEFCFKVPSSEEKSHDFLWRFWSALPAKGSISIFNRSYYEDVLVGKVHKLYENDLMPDRMKKQNIIKQRYEQINDFEKYLYNTGTRVVKIFLNVSRDEQAKRFISRIDTPKKNWKVSSGDLKERESWDDYMEAFEDMVNNTSTKNSPWYVVPADHKWFARLLVSKIVLETLKDIDPHYPKLDDEEAKHLGEQREKLVDSLSASANIDVEKQLTEFANTGLISAGIIQQDEIQKVISADKAVIDSGFRAVRKLIAKNYMIKSTDDIMKAIADEQGELEISMDDEEESEVSTEEILRQLKILDEKDEEGKDQEDR